MNDNTQERVQTNEEAQIYDRQSFIGYQVQKRLLNSKVLIVGLSGSNTELSKNLILSGANLFVADSEIVNEQDVDTNFLFGASELGQNRGELGVKKLKQINPLVVIDLIPALDLQQLYDSIVLQNSEPYFNLKQFNIIATSTKSFNEMQMWDFISQKINIPYYNLICCGLYGFIYITLGHEFTYEREKTIIRYHDPNVKGPQPYYREFERVTANTVTLEKALNEEHNSYAPSKNDIYYCILMMKKSQDDPSIGVFDPFDESLDNQQKLDKILDIGIDIFKKVQKRDPSNDTKATMRNFARLYGVEFCPVYSILGSVASQELIVTISKVNNPAFNWFCYDSQQGYGLTETVQSKDGFIVEDLPEKRQLVVPDQ